MSLKVGPSLKFYISRDSSPFLHNKHDDIKNFRINSSTVILVDCPLEVNSFFTHFSQENDCCSKNISWPD